MADTNAAVAVYDNHSEAEHAVKELQKSGFDMKKLSIVGKDYHTEEDVVGYYAAPIPATSSFEFLLCRGPQCERS